MTWETVIGLEVHIQLATQSKLFSGSSTAYGAEPNTQANSIDLGLPGVLPVVNEEAINMAILLGLAINGEINSNSVFSRKNYFYPDLPKGYQISQYDEPIIGPGHLDARLDDGSTKHVRITRAHLEEDAGKSLHEDFQGMTGIDLNRSGVPLLEIVSEPDMTNAEQAVAYLKALHTLVRYLGICDGNMQEGSFRCDANVSVRQPGEPLGTRTEIKNVNSFRFVEKAINYEVNRQINEIQSGNNIIQETRLFDPSAGKTFSMRSKEEAHDYRYFPEPDLLPVEITNERLEQVRQRLPELPAQKRQRFINDYQLPEDDAHVLATQRSLADYFEKACQNCEADYKTVANWILVELGGALNKFSLSIEQSPITAEHLAQLLNRITDETISGKIAKTVFESMWQQEGTPDEIIEAQGLKQMTDTSELHSIAQQVIADNPQQVEQYKNGKDRLFGFFVGQVMKATQGKANPKQVNQILQELLNT